MTVNCLQHCPICGEAVQENSRYPDYLCELCARRAVSRDERPLAFFNAGMSGGFAASYSDNDDRYDSHLCFVDGTQCWADEARFGGIVLRPTRSGLRPEDGELRA